MQARRLKKYFSLSLLTHITIALYLMFTLSFSNAINKNQAQALPIYIYSIANNAQNNSKPPTQNTQKSLPQETHQSIVQEKNTASIQKNNKSTIEDTNKSIIQYSHPSIIQDNTDSKQPNPIEWITSPRKQANNSDGENNEHFQQQIGSQNLQTKLDQQILQILHESISEKQYYPDEALQSQQHGIVKIAFLLFPDGHLENVSIIRSSGIPSIDSAALNIVENISPNKKAGALLDKPKFFYVDIIFE